MHLATASRLRKLSFVAAALMLAAATSFAAPDLFVTSDASDMVRRYASPSGAFINVFTPSSGASSEMAIHFNAAGTRVLIGHGFNGVEEYDVATAAYIKTYNPGGGWQWAGFYAPNGQVYIGSMFTNDVRRYDPITGAPIGFVCPISGPGDMEVGPNGDLYICSFGSGFVLEVNANTGAFVNLIPLPGSGQANDVAWLPNGDMLVTVMGMTQVCHYGPAPAHPFLGTFAGTSWGNPHGIAIGPHDGRIYVADGVTGQVHVFDPVTFVELNSAYLVPTPGDKIVDIAFLPDPNPTSATPTTWGRIKNLYR